MVGIVYNWLDPVSLEFVLKIFVSLFTHYIPSISDLKYYT